MDANKAETFIERRAIRNVGVNTIFRELKMNPCTVERLRIKFGLKFRKEGCRYFYNLSEVARAYIEAPTKWKLRQVKDACERYLDKLKENRRYFREYRKLRAMKKEVELAMSDANRFAQNNAQRICRDEENRSALDELCKTLRLVAEKLEKETISETEKVESLDGKPLTDEEKAVLMCLRSADCEIEKVFQFESDWERGIELIVWSDGGRRALYDALKKFAKKGGAR